MACHPCRPPCLPGGCTRQHGSHPRCRRWGRPPGVRGERQYAKPTASHSTPRRPASGPLPGQPPASGSPSTPTRRDSSGRRRVAQTQCGGLGRRVGRTSRPRQARQPPSIAPRRGSSRTATDTPSLIGSPTRRSCRARRGTQAGSHGTGPRRSSVDRSVGRSWGDTPLSFRGVFDHESVRKARAWCWSTRRDSLFLEQIAQRRVSSCVVLCGAMTIKSLLRGNKYVRRVSYNEQREESNSE